MAVVFEDEEEDEDRIGDGSDDDEGAAFEVRDDSEDEEEAAIRAQASMGADANAKSAEAGEDEDDKEIIIGNDTYTSSGQSKPKKDSDVVSARDIDGFWLQRLISTSFPDPHETAEKTTNAMTILSSDSNMRDVENSLMDLFDYEKFDLVKTLTKNREKIVWCTKLARTDEQGRMDVEVAMREKGVGWILKELSASAATAAGKQGMEVDPAISQAVSSVPKANIQAGSLVQPRGMVDLESMAFAQGGRLMSNKKCKLPEGSVKRSKKGYEEIHVPPPKKGEPAKGELVPIDTLPEWARPAFKGAETLNRIQSKLYPVAFGDDDPILLCAPTGAGKVCHPHNLRIY